jgi:hypothetical protein
MSNVMKSIIINMMIVTISMIVIQLGIYSTTLLIMRGRKVKSFGGEGKILKSTPQSILWKKEAYVYST